MRKADSAAVKTELLWNGHDDWTGLWEAVWLIQTQYPNLQGDPAREEAKRLLSQMLSEDLIYLCYLDEDTNHETRIEKDEAQRILAEDKSWEPPTSSKHQLRYLTTEKGAKPLFKHAEASS